MILHAIQSMLLYTLLYGCYQLFLKRETFFQFNRFFLLAIPFVALLLPFLRLPIKGTINLLLLPLQRPSNTPATQVPLPLETLSEAVSQPAFINANAHALSIWLLLYGAGMLVAFLLLCYKMAIIQEFIENATPEFKRRYRIMRSRNVQGGFSFLDMIFINPTAPDSLNEVIIKHELIHVQQRHSWDLIVHECARVLFWFNPLLIKAHRDLQATHEFIVDRQLAKQDAQSYKSELLQSIMQCSEYALTNSFYKSSILKNRIAMLQKSNSPYYRLLKLFTLIPIIAMTIGYNATAQTPKVEEQKQPQAVTYSVANISFTQDGTDYPKLSEFVYGKVDFYDGLNKTQISSFEKYSKLDFGSANETFRAFLTDPNIADYTSAIIRIRINGSTLAVDDTGKLVMIQELPNSETTFANVPVDFVYGTTTTQYRNNEMAQSMKPVETVFQNAMATLTRLYNKLEDSNEQLITEYKEDYSSVKKDEKTAGGDVPFAVVYKVPRYEDCTGTNEELKACMSEKIAMFVNQNFNIGVIEKENVGKHRITVQFRISEEGLVEKVVAKAKFSELQAEAIRVLEMLPKMLPAELENGKKVGVIYGLPIIFQIK